jgi:cytochrome c oxidase assembly protein subunit 15
VAAALVVGLVVWTFYATRRDDRTRKAAVASVVFLLLEALLGAVLVLGGYVQNNVSTGRVVMQAIHFTNTMLLLASLTLTAWWLRDHRTPTSILPDRRLTIPAWTALAATIVMGATGALAALADTLFPSTSLLAGFASDFSAGAPALVRIRWVHPAAAVIGFCCVIWLVMKVRSRLSWIVVALLGLQFILGIADVLLLAPTWIQILHLLGADLYWIALVCLAAEALWGQAHTAAFAE